MKKTFSILLSLFTLNAFALSDDVTRIKTEEAINESFPQMEIGFNTVDMYSFDRCETREFPGVLGKVKCKAKFAARKIENTLQGDGSGFRYSAGNKDKKNFSEKELRCYQSQAIELVKAFKSLKDSTYLSNLQKFNFNFISVEQDDSNLLSDRLEEFESISGCYPHERHCVEVSYWAQNGECKIKTANDIVAKYQEKNQDENEALSEEFSGQLEEALE